MKSLTELRLEARISDLIVNGMDGIIAEEVTLQDVTDIAEAIAIKIVKEISNV